MFLIRFIVFFVRSNKYSHNGQKWLVGIQVDNENSLNRNHRHMQLISNGQLGSEIKFRKTKVKMYYYYPEHTSPAPDIFYLQLFLFFQLLANKKLLSIEYILFIRWRHMVG